jgi:actin-related protein 2
LLRCIDIDSDRRLERETTYYNSFYNLPDNRKIRISQEKFEAPEILFNPNLINYDKKGIDGLLYDSIEVINKKLIIHNIYRNVILN